MTETPPVRNGDRCEVVAGTHRGKIGIVADSNLSATGSWTITVRQDDGERFKTLARNTRNLDAQPASSSAAGPKP